MSWKPRQRPAQRRREPARVGGKIGRVLGELGFDLEASLRVSRAFEEALGPDLAPHFELVDCRGQTLEVKAGSSAWSQELAIRQVEVLERMAERLGPGAPTEIRLHVR